MGDLAPEPLFHGDALEGLEAGIAAACQERWAADEALRTEDDTPDLEILISRVLTAVSRPQPVDAGIDGGIAEAAVLVAGGEQSLGTATRQILHVQESVAESIAATLPPDEAAELLERLRVCMGYLIGAIGRARLERANLEASRNRLTGLLAKEAFYNDTRRAALAVADGKERIMVAIDLDGLKAINDNEGHLAGDAALRALAGALQRAVEGNGTAYHLSGDEFALILQGSGSEEGLVEGVVQRAVEAGAPSFSYGLLVLDETASDQEPEDLYHEADIRMLDQKRAKRVARE
jgi:diguanylate cyclase (GGDEF)-like protein